MSDQPRYSLNDVLEMRDVEKPCKRCGGLGVYAYPNTSAWMGGIGGQAITNGVCDLCWGSGDADRPWVNLRTVMAERKAAASLRARVAVLEGALEFYAEVKNHCKPWGHIHSAMDADAGEKARAALAGGGKEGE